MKKEFASMADIAKKLQLSTVGLTKILGKQGLFKEGAPTEAAFRQEYAIKKQTPIGIIIEWSFSKLKPLSAGIKHSF